MLQQSTSIKSQTSGLSDTAQTLTKRQEKESELIDALVTQETAGHGFVRVGSRGDRLEELLSRIVGHILTETMAAYPAKDEVEDSVKEFYTSLYSPPLPSLETAIMTPMIRRKARRQIAQRVCNFYGEIHSGDYGGTLIMLNQIRGCQLF
jgi:hypothetical protein